VSDETPHADDPDAERDHSGTSSDRNTSLGDTDSDESAAPRDEATQDNLSPLSPEDALETYLQVRREELSARSLNAQKSRLSFFVEWCNKEEITNLNDLTKRDLFRFCTWRSDSLNPSSLESNMWTLRSLLRKCVDFDAVPLWLPYVIQRTTRNLDTRNKLSGSEIATKDNNEMTAETPLAEVYRKLVETAHGLDERYGFTVYVLGHTGLKTGEMAQFSPDWLDSRRNLLKVSDPQGNWRRRQNQSITSTAA
jgi:site-specific recombinase XerD